MPLALRILITVFTGAMLSLPGCRNQPRVVDSPPAAFELSITVLNDARSSQPGWQRSARFVVESDGWLRAGTGPGATRDTLPPRIRRLTHSQRQGLWEFTRLSGLLAPDCPIRISAGDGPVPDRSRPLLLITARTDSGLFSGAVPLNSSLAEPFHEMLISLTQWSWISE